MKPLYASAVAGCTCSARWISAGQTVDFYLSQNRDRQAAKLFLKRALVNTDNEPWRVFTRDSLRSYPAAVGELPEEGHLHRRCQQRTKRYCNNPIALDHHHVKRRPARHAWTADREDSLGGDSGNRGSTDDAKGPSTRITRQNLYG
jgi:transposase-like protein